MNHRASASTPVSTRYVGLQMDQRLCSVLSWPHGMAAWSFARVRHKSARPANAWHARTRPGGVFFLPQSPLLEKTNHFEIQHFVFALRGASFCSSKQSASLLHSCWMLLLVRRLFRLFGLFILKSARAATDKSVLRAAYHCVSSLCIHVSPVRGVH